MEDELIGLCIRLALAKLGFKEYRDCNIVKNTSFGIKCPILAHLKQLCDVFC